jgi:tetratricopeptide (TPR) repeat protein
MLRGVARVFIVLLMASSAVWARTPENRSEGPGDSMKPEQAAVFAHLLRAFEYALKGNYDRAIAAFSEVIKLDPRASTYYNRGRAYYLNNEYDRAIADFGEAIRLKPAYAAAHNNRAWTYLKAGKAAEGLPDAERSLQLRPNDANAFDTRGHILEALGRREEAIADFRRALAINPNLRDSRTALQRLGAGP